MASQIFLANYTLFIYGHVCHQLNSIINRKFSAKVLHHEERAKYYLVSILNFTNHPTPNIESVNNTLTFKGSTSQPDRLDFVGDMINDISAHEDDHHWTLVRSR